MVKQLNGKVIAITRPQERSKESSDMILAHGGVPLVTPTLELKISRTDSLMDLCKIAPDLDWIIFTSPAAVDSLFINCPFVNEKLEKCKVAVIGPKTREKLTNNGLMVDLMPQDYTAEGLLEVFQEIDIQGKLIGLPRTLVARKVLPDGLTKRGATVKIAEAYQSALPEDTSKIEELITKILRAEIDAVTFTSPLTVHNFFEVAGKKRQKEIIDIFLSKSILTASIGPITAGALEKYGIKPIIPSKFTVTDMLSALFTQL